MGSKDGGGEWSYMHMSLKKLGLHYFSFPSVGAQRFAEHQIPHRGK